MVTKSKRKTNRTKPRKVNYLRNAEYYDMQPALDRLYLRYSKSKLNPIYLNDRERKAILNAMPEFFEEV